MSTVVYNNVGLIRCDVLGYTREPVYHGPDYQYTTHRITVRGVYNPEINAYSFSNGPAAYQNPAENLQNPANAVFVLRPVPGAQRLVNIAMNGIMANSISPVGSPLMTEGTGAPVTDQAIRHTLMQPRGQLFYAVGNVPLLVSPSVNQDGTIADTDAANGPLPLAVDVVQISGTKTFLVDFSIETYVNEAFLFADTASILLSHRWTRTESIDQDQYSTITTEGVARFRTDRLLFQQVVPDDFRFYFFHPVPERFQRIDWDIQPSEDGSAVAYRLVDRITYLRIAVPGVTRIEAFQTVGGARVGAGPAAIEGAIRTLTPSGETVGGRLGSAVASLFNTVASALPMIKIGITVRVWGTPSQRRKNLEALAIRLLGQRMANALTGLFGAPGAVRVFNLFGRDVNFNRLKMLSDLAGTGLEIHHDLMGTFVEVTASWSVPYPQATFNPVPGNPLALTDIRGAFPNTNDSLSTNAGTLLGRDFLPRNDLYDQNYNFTRPDDLQVGTRAATIQSLMAAALGVADTVPPITPMPPNAGLPDTLNAIPLPP